MSELKCPFCDKKLEPCYGFGMELYSCSDLTCKGSYMQAEDSVWQELIRTRKALELAITGLKNCKTRDHIGAVCRTPEYVDKVLEQITALEQKDVK